MSDRMLGKISKIYDIIYDLKCQGGITRSKVFFSIAVLYNYKDKYTIVYQYYVTGWWYTYPSEKYDFVSWDDDIPNWMESHKIRVPNHQYYVNMLILILMLFV